MPYLKQNEIKAYREKHKPKRCPILGGYTADWVLDHDHKTGMVRGVISRSGNSFLGKIENFLYSRCRQKYKNFPRILRAAANYLEQEQTDVLHPIGLKQLVNRWASGLTSDEQSDVLREMGATEDELKYAQRNAPRRKDLYRNLLKKKYES
jgi:hypothetical protein